MTIYTEDIENAERLKSQIEDALCQLQLYARDVYSEDAFNAYVTGHIEHALEDFTGMGNYSVQGLIDDMKNEVEEEEEEEDE